MAVLLNRPKQRENRFLDPGIKGAYMVGMTTQKLIDTSHLARHLQAEAKRKGVLADMTARETLDRASRTGPRFIVKVSGFALHRGVRVDGEYDGGHSLAQARTEARWFRERCEGGTVTIYYVVPRMGDLRPVEVAS